MNLPKPVHKKPRDVLYAEYALWVWTIYVCFTTIYSSWKELPELQSFIDTNMPGLFTLDPAEVMKQVVVGSILLAALSVWVIYELGRAKRWARTTMMWNFFLQLLMTMMPPQHILMDIPNIGLQIYALHLLYTPASKVWFSTKHP